MIKQTLLEEMQDALKWGGTARADKCFKIALAKIDELERQLDHYKEAAERTHADNKTLHSQLAEAREDQARLEWMINNGGYVVTDGDAHIVWVYGGYAEKRRPAAGFEAIPRIYNTSRQAIDAVMKVKP